MRPVCLLMLSAGVLIAACGDSPPSADREPVSKGVSRAVKEAQAQIVREGVRALRRQPPAPLLPPEAGQPEMLPGLMERRIRPTVGPVARLDFNRAQFVRTPLGLGLWLIPGRGLTCLFREKTGASSCATTVAARRRGMLIATFEVGGGSSGEEKTYLLTGVAPKGAETVKVVRRGVVRLIPVVRHAYAARASAPIRVLGFGR